MDSSTTAACVRLLQCFSCKSVEVIPDFIGDPEEDVLLHYVDEKHGGNTEMPHHRALLRVEKKDWDDRSRQRQIHTQMWADTKGFVPEYYHMKDTLQEDAAKCFVKHKRSIPCIDYQTRSKRIGNPAAGMRRALSRETRRDFTGGGPKVFLCNFCPYQQVVDAKKRELDITHKY